MDYRRPRQWEILLISLVAVILGYATLWNVNYILLQRLGESLNDPAVQRLDVAFYSQLAGGPIEYTSFFPLVREPSVLTLFTNAYSILFGEIVLAIFLICQTGDKSRIFRFLVSLFGLYALGIAGFLLYPVAGPFLYFPESVAHGSGALLNGMANDYKVVMTGNGVLTGYGYFIGMPSLHIILVFFQQTFLYRHKRLFYVFLPANELLIPSTHVLGYHYIADVVVAFLIAVPFCTWFFRAEAKATANPSG
jgi:hypothetical protein